MEDSNHTAETEDDVISKVLGYGMLGFLVLLFGTALLERTGYYPRAVRFFPYALTAFALVGILWLLLKSPMDEY